MPHDQQVTISVTDPHGRGILRLIVNGIPIYSWDKNFYVTIPADLWHVR